MGRKASEILRFINVTQQELESFDAVKEEFQAHFVHTKNVVYESARFNRRKQEMGETVDEFVTARHELASRCEFKYMKERMVRDRFVRDRPPRSISVRGCSNGPDAYFGNRSGQG